MSQKLPPLIVIAGATATGKTRLSLELAEWVGDAEIVGADSRQVYRGMDVGTAKATPAERARVPHHGIDLVDPDEPFTAADFRRHALAALEGIAARGRVALLVGGSGLYLRAVARGVVLESTGRDPALRAQLEARLAEVGSAPLAAELRRLAPGVAGSIDMANPRRVVRALERVLVVGDRPPPAPVGYPAPVLWLGLTAEPEIHARLVVERAAWQFANGLLEESAALLGRYPEDLRAFSAMGYREAFDVLAGRIDLPIAIERDARRTRAYAKRQRTWFRAEPGINWLAAAHGAADAARPLVEPFLGDLERPRSPAVSRPYA
jgi:tRNA dimethylallyltransferase